MTKVAKKAESVDGEKSVGLERLEACMVRISPDKPEYVHMYDPKEGWFVGVNAARVPELHKDIRLLLMSALKNGAALFATAGGIRVMAAPTGRGGLFFIEKKNMLSGKEIYLMHCEDRTDADKVGLISTRGGKGVYVTPRTKDGKIAFTLIAEKFSNNSSPRDFAIHPWKGYTITDEDIKKSAKVKSKKEKKAVVAQQKDGPEKKKVVVAEAKKGEGKVVKLKPKEEVKAPEKEEKRSVRKVAKKPEAHATA